MTLQTGLQRVWSAGLALMCAGLAHAASLGVSFPVATFTLARGQNADLVVSLHNPGANWVLVNGVSGSWPDDVGGAALGEGALALLPGAIGPGETWLGSIGTIQIAPDAPLGHRVIVLALVGGEFEADTDAIGTAYFAVDVQDPACLASVSEAPTPLTVSAGSVASFSVQSSAPGAIAYQWRRNGEDLSDAGTISGAHSASLSIQSASANDAGSYDVLLTTPCGAISTAPVALTVSGVTSAPPAGVSLALALAPPRPNPFSSTARFDWTMPRTAHVRLAIHDLAGRPVVTLADHEYGPGAQSIIWDGNLPDGTPARPGFYVERLEVEGRVLTRRLLRIR